MSTKDNPVDDASRGLDVKEMTCSERWFKGPEFLWEDQHCWPKTQINNDVKEDDPEVKQAVLLTKIVENDLLSRLESQISSWPRIVRVMAYVLKFVSMCRP